MSDMPHDRRYWFYAKTYGWGWGLPATWQGWVVLVAFFVLLIAGSTFLLPRRGVLWFTVYVLVLTAVLIAICWQTGEPPRWRWGND